MAIPVKFFEVKNDWLSMFFKYSIPEIRKCSKILLPHKVKFHTTKTSKRCRQSSALDNSPPASRKNAILKRTLP
jgi:hypothetical protein